MKMFNKVIVHFYLLHNAIKKCFLFLWHTCKMLFFKINFLNEILEKKIPQEEIQKPLNTHLCKQCYIYASEHSNTRNKINSFNTLSQHNINFTKDILTSGVSSEEVTEMEHSLQGAFAR